MLFNSFQFIVFFCAIVALYFALPYRQRWILLLVGSYYFYMCWKPEYIILIVIPTLTNYIAGIQMGKAKRKTQKRKYLVMSLVSNLGILFAFKYFNLFNESVRTAFNHFNLFYNIPAFNLLLPVGISFYTFQTLSYTIDVYRGEREPERHLGLFALYVSFFPQLVAGPIERSTRLLPQFRQHFDFDNERVAAGVRLMLWGLFQKVVIADGLGAYVNQIYNSPYTYNGLPLIMATYLFAFQIYCDFAGYSNIAIGAARVLGYELMENFRLPYFSESIPEFWRRWHISLSSWFKDYLYIPLGGNRATKWRWLLNLFIVFLLSGLWHGAHWKFFMWGAVHGVYMIISVSTGTARQRIADFFCLNRFPVVRNCLRVVITFNLVSVGWIFFRANSLSEAVHIVRHLFVGLGWVEGAVIVLFMFLMLSAHLLHRNHIVQLLLSEKPAVFIWAAYSLLFIISLSFIGNLGSQEFIYFQF